MQFFNSSAKHTYKVLLVDLFVKNLESPTIPLVSETSHMLVFHLLAAKIEIPAISFVSETTHMFTSSLANLIISQKNTLHPFQQTKITSANVSII